MALLPMNIPSPAFYGQAQDRRDFPLGPEWAVETNNLVIDATGRMSARKGWVQQNTDPFDGTADVVQIHEYINESGASEIIFSTPTKLWSGVTVPEDITGSLTFTVGNWKFINFNDQVLGWTAGEGPIAYDGSGTFGTITAASGTIPDGNTALAAFGRVWAVDDDKQTIGYSALLDYTRWAEADGGGTIDMRSVWTQGMDEVVAIHAFGSNLVVFGRRHIIIWTDGSGSQLGLDPENMYVTDTIDNVGVVARDAVTLVGEIDVAFWSDSGIRSLVRTMQERATPVNDISPNNRNYIATGKSTATLSQIRAAYSPQEGLVLFKAPAQDVLYVFDVRQPTPDNGYRMTEWNLDPVSMTVTVSGDLYFGFSGNVGLYSGYTDDDASYPFQYESGWVDIKGDESRKQALKAFKGFFYAEQEQFVQIRWGVDFGSLSQSITRPVGRDGDVAEWGDPDAEWGLSEWGPVGAVFGVRVPLSRQAEYIKARVTTEVNGAAFAVQPLTLYTKPLRVA